MNDNEGGIAGVGQGVMALVVRFIGLFLLLAGLWVALQVLLEALELYRDPRRIERFAEAIEQGSNIDKSLVSFRNEIITEETGEPAGENAVPQSALPSANIRVSYFFAWMIVLLLLLLIARISLAAIKTGGELVLYDMQIKQFARALIRESGRGGR